MKPTRRQKGQFARLRLDALEARLAPAYIVTSLLDSGPGSLRQAVLDANAHAGPDQIQFDPTDLGTIQTRLFLVGQTHGTSSLKIRDVTMSFPQISQENSRPLCLLGVLPHDLRCQKRPQNSIIF